MNRSFFKGLALAGIFSAALGLSQAAQAQTFFRAQAPAPSFIPVGGIPGAVANRPTMRLQSVAIVNGVPVVPAVIFKARLAERVMVSLLPLNRTEAEKTTP